jgi:succinate dehydrogenase / fumarate reductase iron-sulfur subunit
MKDKFLTFRIKRFNKNKTPSDWIETFQLEKKKGMNLLEALLKIRDEQDGSLGFRYSCRGAVCGSCGMKINGKPILACRTILEKLGEDSFFIEPLPNFPLVYDLIVDMSVFFKHYCYIEPYFDNPKDTQPISEYLMDEGKRKEIDPYIQCIHCGICYSRCPAFGRNKEFLGPAILAKAYRFYADPRNERFKKVLYKIDDLHGVWGCNTVYNCERVCPKGILSTHGILKLRKGILNDKLNRVKGFLKKFSTKSLWRTNQNV